MGLIQIFLEAYRPEAEIIFSVLETALEDQGLPLALYSDDDQPANWCVSLYADEENIPALETTIAKVLSDNSLSPKIRKEPIGDIDWVSESLRDLAPVQSGRCLVHGSHDRHVPRSWQKAIEIDAGQAFGTGHHGTTAGCLEMLELCLKFRTCHNVLDLGTGSGVLAIAVARLTNATILASDIDPIAVQVARQNFRLNHCADRIATVVSSGMNNRAFAEHGPFDLIIANILAGPLRKMATSVFRGLRSGGTLILSGLLPHQRAQIIGTYRAQGARLMRAHPKDGWLTLVFEKGNRQPR